MDVVTRFQGSGSNVKRDIYEDDQADEADTMEFGIRRNLRASSPRSTAPRRPAPMPPPSYASTSCRRWSRASTAGSGTARGAACKYKHKLPKGYQFKSDIVAMTRAAAMNKKSDQDELREELEKLKERTRHPRHSRCVRRVEDEARRGGERETKAPGAPEEGSSPCCCARLRTEPRLD